MPKYYCDSSSVRKAHNNGKNHIMNVRNYYAGECIYANTLLKNIYALTEFGSIELGQDKAQAIIDEITKAYERVGQSGFPPQYGYIPGIPPAVNPIIPGAAPQFGVPAPLMLSRPLTGAGAPGTVPPGLSTPPPGIGSAPGMGAPGVGGPPSGTPIIETEPGYSPIKIDPTPPGIRPSIVSPTNATSLGPNSSLPPNQQYGTPGYIRPSGPASQGPIGGYPTTQGPQANIPPGSAPPGSVPPPGGASYQQYLGGHLPQHYPPGSGTNSSSSLPPQPSRGVKRQMEE